MTIYSIPDLVSIGNNKKPPARLTQVAFPLSSPLQITRRKHYSRASLLFRGPHQRQGSHGSLQLLELRQLCAYRLCEYLVLEAGRPHLLSPASRTHAHFQPVIWTERLPVLAHCSRRHNLKVALNCLWDSLAHFYHCVSRAYPLRFS